MLNRFFGNDGFFGGGAWWIIILFFFFLALGEKVYLVEGNRENIKLTTPFDLKLAELLCLT